MVDKQKPHQEHKNHNPKPKQHKPKPVQTHSKVVPNHRYKQVHPDADNILRVTANMGNPACELVNSTIQNMFRGYDQAKRDARGIPQRQSAVKWDCSEMSSNIMQSQLAVFRDYEKQSGYKFRTNLKALSDAFPLGSTTKWQSASLDKIAPVIKDTRSGILEMAKNGELKPGMVFFMKYSQTKSGYDGHVATVVREPVTGQLKIAESVGGVGVALRDINEFFSVGKAGQSTTKFRLYDPFSKDRAELDRLDAEAQRISQLYQEAKRGQTNGIQKVNGGKMDEKQIQEYIRKTMNHENKNNNLQHKLQVATGITELNLASLQQKEKPLGPVEQPRNNLTIV